MCICRSSRRPEISTAAIGPAITCLPAASCASTRKPASACGTSSSSITISGTTTSRRRPNLINITVNGKPIRAVAQVTKQSYVFVFDRVTGAPVWPIEERKVPGRRHARRMVFADAAASDEARAVRSSRRAGKGSDRFHARAERAGSRDLQPVPEWPAVHAAQRAHGHGARHSAASRQSGFGAMAGRCVGSRDEHAVCAVGVEHDGAGASARRHALGHDLYRRRRRRW